MFEDVIRELSYATIERERDELAEKVSELTANAKSAAYWAEKVAEDNKRIAQERDTWQTVAADRYRCIACAPLQTMPSPATVHYCKEHAAKMLEERDRLRKEVAGLGERITTFAVDWNGTLRERQKLVDVIKACRDEADQGRLEDPEIMSGRLSRILAACRAAVGAS
jgi:hypothetical protein